eukprot:Protomagalhaensia_wolfi_Nauph_80__1912@NODE_21_length_4819_cov_15_300837_g16_i0_p4_GENE_NODE_21_length_4819_cov_15_300837_g16_i0NODE_21_length_4819_cov_15_300837_g16_i0_p4_ORF_typecomplete_len223_score63_40Ebp2/PF05890_12/3_1e26_NODE_21_length_4819_cov_15_300837_g16_i031833851
MGSSDSSSTTSKTHSEADEQQGDLTAFVEELNAIEEDSETEQGNEDEAANVKKLKRLLAEDEPVEICDEAGLKRVLKEISYPLQPDGKRFPWIERLDYVSKEKLPEIEDNSNIAREKALFQSTLNATRAALLKVKYLGVAFARPKDFMAEMMKEDAHMKRLHDRVEAQRIRIEKFNARVKNPQLARGTGASRKPAHQKDPNGGLTINTRKLTKKRGIRKNRR